MCNLDIHSPFLFYNRLKMLLVLWRWLAYDCTWNGLKY